MHHVCPWYIGYFLISPLRAWRQNPAKILAPYIKAGDIVFGPGPGMGFFTLEMARKVGKQGRVYVSDIQLKMLNKLRKRAVKAGVIGQIEIRQARPDSFGVDDIAGKVDFVMAFAIVHEMPSVDGFFKETSGLLKKGGRLLLAEPRSHTPAETFAEEIDTAQKYGFKVVDQPIIRASRAAVLEKS
jgi:ubiquinone/menaquinone biosynthesis C-methylase UbiE